MIGIKPLVGILSFNDAIMFLECCSSFVIMVWLIYLFIQVTVLFETLFVGRQFISVLSP
jgi:hypothetical protein